MTQEERGALIIIIIIIIIIMVIMMIAQVHGTLTFVPGTLLSD